MADSLHNPTGRGTKTDAAGNYMLSPLPPGKYNVMVSVKGYSEQRQEGVIVRTDMTTFIDFHLKPLPPEPKKKKK